MVGARKREHMWSRQTISALSVSLPYPMWPILHQWDPISHALEQLTVISGILLTSLTSSALNTHGAMPPNLCTKNKTLFCNGHTFLMYPFHKQELETNWICPAHNFIGTPKHFWDDFYSGMRFWFNMKCGTWKTFDSLSYTRVNFVSTADISDLCSIIKMTYLLDDFFGHTLHYSWHGTMQPVVKHFLVCLIS